MSIPGEEGKGALPGPGNLCPPDLLHSQPVSTEALAMVTTATAALLDTCMVALCSVKLERLRMDAIEKQVSLGEVA